MAPPHLAKSATLRVMIARSCSIAVAATLPYEWDCHRYYKIDGELALGKFQSELIQPYLGLFLPHACTPSERVLVVAQF